MTCDDLMCAHAWHTGWQLHWADSWRPWRGSRGPSPHQWRVWTAMEAGPMLEKVNDEAENRATVRPRTHLVH